MFKEIVIYAGANKTGTCSVRDVLQKSRSELLQQGIFYPGMLRPKDDPVYLTTPSYWDVEPIAKAIQRESEQTLLGCAAVQELDVELRQHADSCNKAILVSEHFYDTHGSDCFRIWCDHLRQFTDVVSIYVTVRRYPEYWESVFRHWLLGPWEHSVRFEDCTSLSVAFDLYLAQHPRIGFAYRMEDFERIVGEEHVTVHPFSSDGTNVVNAVPGILAQLGVCGLSGTDTRINQSLPLDVFACLLEVIRSLKRRYGDAWQKHYYNKAGDIRRKNIIAPLSNVPPILSRSRAKDILQRGIEEDKEYVLRKFGKTTLFSTTLDRYGFSPTPLIVSDARRKQIGQMFDL